MAEQEKKVSNSSVEGKKKPERMVFIAGDSVDTMIEMDKDGMIVDFDVDQFPDLGDDVKKLSKDARTRYFVARSLHLQAQKGKSRDRKSREIAERIEILDSMDFGARAKLKEAEKYVEKGMHLAYKDPSEVDYAKERHGYKPVKGKDGTTYAIKGKEGKDELVAMQIPEEKYQKHLKAVGRLSRGSLSDNFEGAKDEAARAIHRPGERVIVRDYGDNEWPED